MQLVVRHQGVISELLLTNAPDKKMDKDYACEPHTLALCARVPILDFYVCNSLHARGYVSLHCHYHKDGKVGQVRA